MSSEEKINPADIEAVAPTEDEIRMTDEEAEFVFTKAAKVNALIDSAGMALMEGDRHMLGLSLAALFSYGFNLGKEYVKNNYIVEEFPQE